MNEVLQAVVGNYFRDTLQGMAAVQFIENRAAVQRQAQAYIIEQTGRARGAEVESVGLARANGFEAQKQALGAETTALVNVVSELVKSATRLVPDILVAGSNGSHDAISAGVMGFLRAFQRQHEPPSVRG